MFEEQIRKSAVAGHLVRILYSKIKTGETKEYLVEPYKIENFKRLFWARRRDIDAPYGIRSFRLDRILSAEEIEESFDPLWPILIF